MKRFVMTFIFAFIAVFAVSVTVCSAGSIADEYLKMADELRVRAATEPDASKRDEMFNQADEYEQRAEDHTPPQPESIFEDAEDADAASAQRSREQLDRMRRDYERDSKVQDGIDEDVNKRICASCDE